MKKRHKLKAELFEADKRNAHLVLTSPVLLQLYVDKCGTLSKLVNFLNLY